MYRIILLFFVGSMLIFQSCGDEEKKSSANQQSLDESKQPVEKVKIPRFNRDSAYHYIEEQVAFGPRVPGTDAHIQAKNYLQSKLESYASEVMVQEFTASTYDDVSYKGYNIFGSFNPDLEQRILLLAHWDSRRVADHDPNTEMRSEMVIGANDGGSGVGVLLEVARQLKENPVDIGVDILFVDLEDQGEDKGQNPESWALGAQHFAKNMPRSSVDYRFGILLDMVGAENAQFPKEQISQVYAKDFHNKVWNLAQAMGYGNYFLDKKVGGVTDDHYFINKYAGIPTIDIIDKRNTEKGFFPQWHTTEDNMKHIDKSTLRAVGQVTLAVVYKSYNGDF